MTRSVPATQRPCREAAAAPEFVRPVTSAGQNGGGSRRTLLIGGHAVWGALLILAPGRATGHTRPAAGAALRTATRVLGARHIVEAGLLARHVADPPPGWAVGVDAIHAATMVALALASPRLRGAALRSATMAGLFAAVAAARP